MLTFMSSYLIKLAFWLIKSLIIYFVLIVALHSLWRAIKIILARNWKKPVSGREAILISGATSGIGLAISKYLYKLGYSIIVGYYDSQEIGYSQLKQMAEDTNLKVNEDQKMMFIQLNVCDVNSISEAYKKVSILLSNNDLKLYSLINNAGLGSLQPFAWLQRNEIQNIINTNLTGTLLMTREFLPLLVESKGRILNVSSGLGFTPGSTFTTYGATKCALIYLTNSLNNELKSQFGVKSIAVIPHNYIKNTNICSSIVTRNQNAWSELKEKEKLLYNEQYNEHCSLLQSLEEETRKHVSKACNNNNNNNKIRQQQQLTKQQNESGFQFQNLVTDFLDRLKGKNSASSLEESGALECFEDALRLIEPPQHIFAGDNIYNILVASFIFSWPISCNNLLGRSISPSLYR